ncbi:MAG: hypothetical protein ACI9OJ_000578 [Myxococcota bacterium]|jgi:hypothetical protein
MTLLPAAHRFTIALAGLVMAACTGVPADSAVSELETVESPIKGGYNDDSTTAVVGIVRLSNFGLGICSGTLIAPNVVLTAQHCVSPINNSAPNGGVQCGVSSFGSAYPASQMYVSTDGELGQFGEWRGAKEIRVVPGDGNVCGQDVAIMILQSPIDVTPRVPRVDEIVAVSSIGVGEIYSAVGYGNIDDENGSGRRRRRDSLSASCVAQFCPFWASTTQTEWIGETGVCQGDSGGPALDSVGRVIGVASRGGAGCSSPVYGGLWEYSDWLIENVRDATESAGITPPNWSLGFPTDPLYSHAVGAGCGDGDDCSSGMCETGFCTRRCIVDAPCPDGWKCSAQNGICRPAPVGQLCAADTQCDSGLCQKGHCTRFCDDVVGCPIGYGCNIADLCEIYPIGAACSSDDECPSNTCTAGYCTRGCDANAPCPAPWGCDPETGMCAEIPLAEACGTDAECAGGTCLDGACTFGCSADVPCPATHGCNAENQLCEAIPVGAGCSSDAECGQGSCVDGGCTSGCTETADCLDGYVCATSTCILIEVGAECESDAVCADGRCVDGSCTRDCSLQAPCPGGYLCDPSNAVCIAAPDVSTEPGSGCSAVPRSSSPIVPVMLFVTTALGWTLRRRSDLRPATSAVKTTQLPRR